MELLDNTKTQVEFYIIHVLILSVMSTNKEELVKTNGYGAIFYNDEAENNFYIVPFTYVPYKLQDDVQSDGNQLLSGDLV